MVLRSRTAPPLRRPSPARAAGAPIATATNSASVKQHFLVIGNSSFSIVVDVVDDGQAIGIVADSGDRRDLLARTQIDHEDGAARGSGGRVPGATGYHGVPAVGRHRGAFRARW